MPLNVRLESDADSWRVKALGLISPHHRAVYSMNCLDAPTRIILCQSVMTADRKLFLVRNSKVGGTSVERMLYQYVGVTPHEGSSSAHDPNVIHGIRDWRPCYAALRAHEPVIFCQVRHPVDRLMSAFRDFFVARKNPWRWRHMTHMRRMGYSGRKSQEYNLDVFLDYVTLSFETSLLYTDRHWRKQVISLGYGQVPYDVIGRTETMVEDVKKVLELAGISEAGLLNVLEHRFNNTDAVRDKQRPTPSQRQRIAELYADDFEAFNY